MKRTNKLGDEVENCNTLISLDRVLSSVTCSGNSLHCLLPNTFFFFFFFDKP